MIAFLLATLVLSHKPPTPLTYGRAKTLSLKKFNDTVFDFDDLSNQLAPPPDGEYASLYLKDTRTGECLSIRYGSKKGKPGVKRTHFAYGKCDTLMDESHVEDQIFGNWQVDVSTNEKNSTVQALAYTSFAKGFEGSGSIDANLPGSVNGDYPWVLSERNLTLSVYQEDLKNLQLFQIFDSNHRNCLSQSDVYGPKANNSSECLVLSLFTRTFK